MCAIWSERKTNAFTGESLESKRRPSQCFAAGVGQALRKAAKDAAKTARMHGTPPYVWENGRVVAKKPEHAAANDSLDKRHLRATR
jgi:hypothetical protein